MCRAPLFLRTCFHNKVKTSGRKKRVGIFFLYSGLMVFRVESPRPQGPLIVHFLDALAADLVILPSPVTLSTPLMTPTATVCRISRTANRPSGGY